MVITLDVPLLCLRREVAARTSPPAEVPRGAGFSFSDPIVIISPPPPETSVAVRWLLTVSLEPAMLAITRM